MTESNLSHRIVDLANSLGFDACGMAEADFLKESSEHVEQWLSEGFEGDMTYLDRNKEKRYDPRLLVEGTQTVVTVIYNYYPKTLLPADDNFKIAKYAYGNDYHEVLKQKLRELLEGIEAMTGKLAGTRVFVDSAPVLDRAWAVKCGLGFIGKNTTLIHPKKGSFFFIGHLFLPIKMEPFGKVIPNHCGRCSRCIDVCPTGALKAPFQIDARRCLSYLTIEHKGPFEGIGEDLFHDWIYGCDICQDVCPYNRFATGNDEPLFQPSAELLAMRKEDWVNLDKPGFDALFRKSAVKRAGYEGLKRNIDFLAKNEASI